MTTTTTNENMRLDYEECRDITVQLIAQSGLDYKIGEMNDGVNFETTYTLGPEREDGLSLQAVVSYINDEGFPCMVIGCAYFDSTSPSYEHGNLLLVNPDENLLRTALTAWLDGLREGTIS